VHPWRKLAFGSRTARRLALEFRNDAVDVKNLPAWEALALAPISRRYAPCRLLAVMLWGVVLTAAVGLSPEFDDIPGVGDWRVAAAVAGLFLLRGVLVWIEARYRAWALREHDLVYRSGVVVQSTVILPLARIQHVETVSGPLERAFGLVRLNCYSAGGLSTDLVVAGLERTTAERVRQYLLGRIRELDDEPAADGGADG